MGDLVCSKFAVRELVRRKLPGCCERISRSNSAVGELVCSNVAESQIP